MKPHKKTPFKIHDLVIGRVAASAYENYQLRDTQAWLNDPIFLTALKLASQSLYEAVKRALFRSENLNPDNIRALRKYANRMTGRPIPFGAFSGFFLTSFNGEKIRLKDNFLLNLQEDLGEILRTYDKQPLNQAGMAYKTNPTLYHVNSSTRLLATIIKAKGSTACKLQAFNKDKLITDIMEFCKYQKQQSAIIKRIADAGLDIQDATLMFEDLINEKLLLPVSFPRITNECTKLNKLDLKDRKVQKTIVRERASDKWYANLQLTGDGGLPSTVKSNIEQAILAFLKLSPSTLSTDLDEFKTSFIKRFGERQVPLMEALDPEIGLPYAGISANSDGTHLIQGMDSYNETSPACKIIWGAVHRLLMSRWPMLPGCTIEITDEDLDQLAENKKQLPPGFSILFRHQKDKIWIDSCGGCSALQLPGRFSVFDNKLRKGLISIAMEEQINYPNIIFAEIITFSEGRTDNVSRRSVLRPYEIPVTAASSLPEEQQLPPSSLLLSVVDDEFVLEHPRLKMRVVPRLSSAYNYKRSAVPLIRFLGDLQYQGVQQIWTADPANFFPGLNHYPRILYKNTVLSPASWRIKSDDIKKAVAKGVVNLSSFLSNLNLPRFVAVGEGDRYLTCDLQNDDDIALFVVEASAKDDITVREVPSPDKHDSFLTNSNGQTHIAQFNALVTTLNNDVPNFKKPDRIKCYEPILPGMSWLYYKLYLPPSNSDLILSKIFRIVKSLKKSGTIDQWFFVRYLDPKPHLRLRFKLGKTGLAKVLTSFSALFKKEIYEGRLHTLSIETYEPEYTRYQKIGMNLAEGIFNASSDFFRSALGKPGFEHHTFALRTTYDCLVKLIPKPQERLTMMAQVRNQLLSEESEKAVIKSILEKKKREMKQLIETVLGNEKFYQHLGCVKASDNYFTTFLKIRHMEGDQLQTIADLCHMHINRCFPAKMRQQELVIYTLLYQYELTMQKRIIF